MFRGFSGRQRVAPLAERRTAARLREALAALPAPWAVLANRRASGADGPPWVRFVALHPEKGVALVDTDSPDAAVAPLEDFLARTGFAALQAGALPIVPVAVGAGEVGVVADLFDAAFASTRGNLGNPNWCEAVMELLLTAPDLMLAQLRHVPPAARPSAPEPPVQPARRVAQSPRRAAALEPTRAEPSLSQAPQPQPPQSQARTAPPAEAPRASPPIKPAVPPETPRLVPRQVGPHSSRTAAPPPAEPGAMRLVPRRVSLASGSPSLPTSPTGSHAEPPSVDDALEIPRGTGRRTPVEPVEPQFGRHGEGPRFALEAEEPIIPLRQTRASRRREPSLRTGALHPDAALTDWRAPRRRWPLLPIAAGLLLVAVGAIALWYRAAPPPREQATAPSATPPTAASLTPPTVPTPPPPTATPAPTPAATAPSPLPAPPPLHATATPQPPAAMSADDLPRAMLQPRIASAPPLPPPLPAAKLAPHAPVRTAAVPKPVKAAPAAPAPKTATAEPELPAPIAAVLHPEATPAPPSQPAVTAVTPATPPASPAPPAASSAPQPGGTVTVDGVTYVNGEQPHALGNVGAQPPASAAPASAPTAPALASNGPVNPPAPSPPEVVISRAPSATAVPAPAAGSAAVANGPPREVVISRAPSATSTAPPAPDAPPPGGARAIPSNENPPDANGPPSSIQAAPLSGSSP
jgi:hypothetical protein